MSLWIVDGVGIYAEPPSPGLTSLLRELFESLDNPDECKYLITSIDSLAIDTDSHFYGSEEIFVGYVGGQIMLTHAQYPGLREYYVLQEFRDVVLQCYGYFIRDVRED